MKRTSITSIRMTVYISLALFCLSVEPIVIVTHGTFATDADWYRPGGAFYTILEREARTLGELVIPFTWSGKLSNTARLQAAQALAKVILSYPRETITLIGHSHGGNIIALASKLLSEDKPQVPFCYTEDMAVFLQAYRGIRKIRRSISKKYLIEHVYLLATPIDMKNYAPNMDIINHVYNFYSPGDKIQSILGFYKQSIKNLERTVNFKVTIDDGIEHQCPSHEDMHHPLIARWLLSIPDILKESRRGGFEHFTWDHTYSTLYFTVRQPPRYAPLSHR
jgi:hypothetical protein